MNARVSQLSWSRAIPGAAIIAMMAVLLALAALVAAPSQISAQAVIQPCKDQVVGTSFTMPAMTAGQKATLPVVANAKALCIESVESGELVGVKLEGDTAYTAQANDTALTVDSELKASMVISSTFNGTMLTASPQLPRVVVTALTDTSAGIALVVGQAKLAAPVMIEQWTDVKIPGSLGELKAGTTKWSGNGVSVLVTSGMAFTANGNAVLPEVGKLAEYEFFVDAAMELKLAGTVPGQRFYLAVSADSLANDAWLQKRVEAKASPAGAAASTAGAQYTNISGACFSAATCSASQAVACVTGAPKLPCTLGDTLSVWRASRVNPRTHPVNH